MATASSVITTDEPAGRLKNLITFKRIFPSIKSREELGKFIHNSLTVADKTIRILTEGRLLFIKIGITLFRELFLFFLVFVSHSPHKWMGYFMTV